MSSRTEGVITRSHTGSKIGEGSLQPEKTAVSSNTSTAVTLAHNQGEDAMIINNPPSTELNTTVRNKPTPQPIAEEEHMIIELQPEPQARDGTTAGKALLAARRGMRKKQSQLARSDSHLQFFQECQTQRITPKGLQIKVKCNPLLPSSSNVLTSFEETKNHAQEEFKDKLADHYTITRSALEKEIQELDQAMSTALTSATEEEREEHGNKMTTSYANLEKEKANLLARKERKLEITNNPPPPRPPNSYLLDAENESSNSYSDDDDVNLSLPEPGKPNLLERGIQGAVTLRYTMSLVLIALYPTRAT